MVIDGKKISQQILAQIKKQTTKRSPTLAIVQIGHRPDSDIYIRQKISAAVQAGITTKQFHCQLRSSQVAIVQLLKKLSLDSAIDGILLQLPVPSHLDTKQLIQAIDPKKDVDGFHPDSKKISPLIQAIERCLLAGKKTSGHIVLLGHHSIFTQSLTERLLKKGFTVSEYSAERTIPPQTKKADIVITVRGRGPRLLARHLKKGSVVIDGGIRRFEERVSGDADASIADVVSAYTPVPGGVGPLTVAYALKNIVKK